MINFADRLLLISVPLCSAHNEETYTKKKQKQEQKAVKYRSIKC